MLDLMFGVWMDISTVLHKHVLQMMSGCSVKEVDLRRHADIIYRTAARRVLVYWVLNIQQ